MDDRFRLDLEGYDKAYIQEMLDTFLEDAINYGRKLIDIRMSKVMFDKLEVAQTGDGALYKGVPITIGDTGFDGTIEVILGPLQ